MLACYRSDPGEPRRQPEQSEGLSDFKNGEHGVYLGDGRGELIQDLVHNLVIVAAEGWPGGLGAKELGLGEIQRHKSGEDNLRNKEGDKQ